jgi:hypothetical protein
LGQLHALFSPGGKEQGEIIVECSVEGPLLILINCEYGAQDGLEILRAAFFSKPGEKLLQPKVMVNPNDKALPAQMGNETLKGQGAKL